MRLPASASHVRPAQCQDLRHNKRCLRDHKEPSASRTSLSWACYRALHSDKRWGRVALLDPWPLIRGDVRFAGWELISDEEIRQQSRVLPAAVVATVTATPRPVIVKARKPRPRR
jgi:hypothetical protein